MEALKCRKKKKQSVLQPFGRTKNKFETTPRRDRPFRSASGFPRVSDFQSTTSGKGLSSLKPLSEVVKDSHLSNRLRCYDLSISAKTTNLAYGENRMRDVATNSGVRTFATFYRKEKVGFLGRNALSKIQYLAFWFDELISRTSKKMRSRVVHDLLSFSHRLFEMFLNYSTLKKTSLLKGYTRGICSTNQGESISWNQVKRERESSYPILLQTFLDPLSLYNDFKTCS